LPGEIPRFGQTMLLSTHSDFAGLRLCFAVPVVNMLLLIAQSLFLTVVVLAAVICLLGLVKKVDIDPYYQKRLFISVILVMASIVFSFVRTGLKPPPKLADLVQLQSTWDANYPEKSWRTQYRFAKEAKGVRLQGSTYLVVDGKPDVNIIQWRGVDPIALDGLEEPLTLNVVKTWTPEAATAYPALKYEVGKGVQGTITLRANLAIRGQWIPSDASKPWGLMLTEPWH
jgi:hypothetical protein